MQTFGISPSKEVGFIKDAITEAILEGEIPNEFEAGFQFMLREGEKMGLTPKRD
jgi:tRNA nucleotidyltransferase (CCA-adding enzyme)